MKRNDLFGSTLSIGLLALLFLFPGQSTFADDERVLLHTEFSVLQMFTRSELYDSQKKIGLSEQQQSQVRKLIVSRRMAQNADDEQLDGLMINRNIDVVQAFAAEVKTREQKREREAIETLRSVLDARQETALGELIICNKGFDAFGNPFARSVLELDDRQVTALFALQTKLNSPLGSLLESGNDPVESERQLSSELGMRIARIGIEVFDILRTKQLERYFRLRGKLKESEPLAKLVESFPAALRTEILARLAKNIQRDG